MSLTTLAAAADAARARLGSILVTVTVITPDGTEVARVATTHPEVYPVGGRKRLDPSQTSPQWAELVVAGQQPFVGADRDTVRSFFFDWETIEALGCGAIVNTPVVHDGVTIGSINFLGPEGSLTADAADIAMQITAQATPAVVAARDEAFGEVRP
jgi:nucleoid-associated protein YgaU